MLARILAAEHNFDPISSSQIFKIAAFVVSSRLGITSCMCHRLPAASNRVGLTIFRSTRCDFINEATDMLEETIRIGWAKISDVFRYKMTRPRAPVLVI